MARLSNTEINKRAAGAVQNNRNWAVVKGVLWRGLGTVIKLGATAGIRCVFNREWTPIDANVKNRISQNQQFHSKTIFIRVHLRPFAAKNPQLDRRVRWTQINAENQRAVLNQTTPGE